MRRLLGIALLAALIAPSAAAADVIGSQVTSPADGARFLDDDALATDEQIVVRGTVSGSGDVDLVCERGGAQDLVANDVPVAGGGFSAAVGLDVLAGRTCTLRALPATGFGGAYAPFAGPRIAVSEFSEQRLDGALYDFDLDVQDFAGSFAISSAGGGALEASALHAAGLAPLPGAWAATATFDRRDLGGAGPRSALLVDGRFAYTPADARSLFGDGAGGDPDSHELAGFPALAVSRSFDATGGRVTLTERSPLVRCPTDSASPSFATCDEFVATGVELERRWELGPGGLAAVADRFRSTGAAHTVSPEVGVGSACCTTAWAYGSGGFDVYANGTVVPAPAAPFVATRYDRSLSADSAGAAAGSIVFHSRPQQLRFFSESGFDALYPVLDVAAGGTSAELRHTFVVGPDVARSRAAATRVADALAAPVVTIATPADGEVVPTDNVLVAGSVDDVAVVSVAVNGAPAIVAADRTWMAFAPLARGANRLTVVATDTAGNTGEASRAVTYSEPLRERVAPAGITRTLTPARDRRPPFRFRVAGRVILPRDVTVGEACNGVLLITVRAGKRILTTRTAELLGECSYKSGLFKWRNRKPFGRGRKNLTVGVRFTGNAVLRGKTATRTRFRVR